MGVGQGRGESCWCACSWSRGPATGLRCPHSLVADGPLESNALLTLEEALRVDLRLDRLESREAVRAPDALLQSTRRPRSRCPRLRPSPRRAQSRSLSSSSYYYPLRDKHRPRARLHRRAGSRSSPAPARACTPESSRTTRVLFLGSSASCSSMALFLAVFE